MRHRRDDTAPPPLEPCGWTEVHAPHGACPGLEPLGVLRD